MSKKAPLPNLADMSIEELVSLKSYVDIQIKKTQRAEKKAVLKKMDDLAKKAGFGSASEIIDGGSRVKKTRSDKGMKHPPKFQNPSDANKTWSGQGRVPQWMIDYEKKKGNSRDDLLIVKK